MAPALQPVTMESCLVISASPDQVLNVFPQKSFAALTFVERVIAHYVKERTAMRW